MRAERTDADARPRRRPRLLSRPRLGGHGPLRLRDRPPPRRAGTPRVGGHPAARRRSRPRVRRRRRRLPVRPRGGRPGGARGGRPAPGGCVHRGGPRRSAVRRGAGRRALRAGPGDGDAGRPAGRPGRPPRPHVPQPLADRVPDPDAGPAVGAAAAAQREPPVAGRTAAARPGRPDGRTQRVHASGAPPDVRPGPRRDGRPRRCRRRAVRAGRRDRRPAGGGRPRLPHRPAARRTHGPRAAASGVRVGRRPAPRGAPLRRWGRPATRGAGGARRPARPGRQRDVPRLRPRRRAPGGVRLGRRLRAADGRTRGVRPGDPRGARLRAPGRGDARRRDRRGAVRAGGGRGAASAGAGRVRGRGIAGAGAGRVGGRFGGRSCRGRAHVPALRPGAVPLGADGRRPALGLPRGHARGGAPSRTSSSHARNGATASWSGSGTPAAVSSDSPTWTPTSSGPSARKTSSSVVSSPT